MQQIKEFFVYVWTDQTARLVFCLALSVAMILVAVYVVQKVRQMAVGTPLREFTDSLTDFREMQEKGLIDEQEFRRVRTVVTQPPAGEPAQQETNNEASASS
ncbi:MAG TPA: hypothetical protein PKD54_05880 [Pirellulaceae bacterium]|nr:hypothetical protein [Pirellulaceae bacterium]